MDERKQIARARPPEALTDEVRRNIFSIARGAVEDGTPDSEKMIADLSRVLGPNESSKQSQMASACAILLRAIKEPKDTEREIYTTALTKGKWSRDLIARGFAWCLTNVVETREVIDCPRIYSRFVDVVVNIPELTFLSIAKEIMARTANYLDSLMIVCEFTDEWEEDFIRVWDMIVLKQKDKPKPSINKVMEALGSARLGPFMRNVLPDLVATLMQVEFFTEDDLRKWGKENESNQRLRPFIEELAQLYP